MRLIRGVAALAVLCALVVGVPWLLVLWGDPLALITVEWSTALLRPDDGTIILGLLSIAGWIAWLVLVLTLFTEVVGVLTKRDWSLPGTAWLQPVMRGLVMAILAPTVAASASAAAHAQTPPPPSATPIAAPDTPSRATEAVQARSDIRSHVVLPGEELWGIAQQELGSGERWREIVALNPGVTAEESLTVGSSLVLPQAPDEPGRGENTVEVQAGDTLWDLADEHLQDTLRWPELHETNRHLISDPDQIDIGWVLELPPEVTSEAGTEPGAPEGAPEATPPEPAAPTEETSASWPAEVTRAERQATPPPPAPPPMSEAVQDGAADPTGLLGPIGGVLAAGVFGGIAARRRLQLLHRSIGTRLVPTTPQLERFMTALGRRAKEESAAECPEQPTSVTLGWEDDEAIQVDLEALGCVTLSGDRGTTAGMAASILTSLMCSPQSATVSVIAVQPDQQWDQALDDPRLSVVEDLVTALGDLQRLVAKRRIGLADRTLADVRSDEDLAEAFAPVVMVLCAPVETAHLHRIHDAMDLGDVGVSVVACATAPSPPSLGFTDVLINQSGEAVLDQRAFAPQMLDQPARRAIVDLFTASLGTNTEPAPWWHHEPLPPNVSVLPRRGVGIHQEDAMPAWTPDPEHPTLLLLGDVDLIGARGTKPSRAVGQCMEYCAYLLEHPGTTATTMVSALLVAETTRRSNMSRLRTWLGHDAEQKPYLPDAYTGRITLHPEVTSDWERFCLLLSGGVNLASDESLREALLLVRDEPLNGVAFQWPWTQHLRNDMISMIVDAASVLADRQMERGDFEAARWSLDQGSKAAGDDEVLASRRIQILALEGDQRAVDKALLQLTRAARAENRDLHPDTARRIQAALHTVRARTSANL